ncbi:hypothetical protein JQ543_30855 [Bradyrhizobium diazoefficiens]|nr:hypothetical protein [Bradyrhizobium diazoefficiens]MBR0778998.1 hypothetical protein [Bradyrhizobium diazoefficiens]MBR0852171.1 hypothetical protein [Bradyrhizobium diazoefficiens]
MPTGFDRSSDAIWPGRIDSDARLPIRQPHQGLRGNRRASGPDRRESVHGVVFEILVLGGRATPGFALSGYAAAAFATTGLAEPKLRQQRRLETRPGFEPG